MSDPFLDELEKLEGSALVEDLARWANPVAPRSTHRAKLLDASKHTYRFDDLAEQIAAACDLDLAAMPELLLRIDDEASWTEGPLRNREAHPF